jgi:hypothetical protein
MKLLNKINALTLASTAFLISANTTFAVTTSINPCPTEGGFTKLCNVGKNGFGPVLGQVLQIVLTIAVVIALAFLIWGGIKWIMSGGDKAKVESARNTIIAAIIGLIVAFLAYFVIQIVLNLFGMGSIDQLGLPKIQS